VLGHKPSTEEHLNVWPNGRVVNGCRLETGKTSVRINPSTRWTTMIGDGVDYVGLTSANSMPPWQLIEVLTGQRAKRQTVSPFALERFREEPIRGLLA